MIAYRKNEGGTIGRGVYMLDKDLLEKAVNDTYPGITMLYRDANLGDLANLYKNEMIIKEKAFVDASLRGGGIITTHRYAILSNHFMDASEFEHGTNWGLCIMQKDSYFKVIDIYKKNGKTQITLLHLLNQYWELFKNTVINLDEELIEYTRNSFNKHLKNDPVLELTTDVWLDRCSFPLGMNHRGEFFKF